MYQLTTHASFDSAHFLSGYEGKCSNIHGHRWKLEVTVQSETLEQTGQIRGMVVDFGQLKDDIKREDSRSIERGKFQNDLCRFSSNCREFCKIFL